MVNTQQSSYEAALEPVKEQYAHAKEWVQDRSPAQLAMLIIGPLLVLGIIGFVIYRFMGGQSNSRSSSRSTSRRARAGGRVRSRRARVGTTSRRRNGARSTLTTGTP